MKNLLVLLLSLVFMFVTTLKANDTTEGNTNELLQFTAGGHVIAFMPECLYLTGSDHMLKVTFQNANVTTPEAEQCLSMEISTQPLEKVIYPELWNGISLAYEKKGGSIAKSTYFVSPGSDASQISLRYNVPVRLDNDGKLVFEFETGKLSETAPVAWQIINGERFAVEVEFCRHREKVIGFKVGEYNPSFHLIIDPSWEWNTFMGGSSSDYGNSIAVDGSGNVYLAGTSNATWGSPVNAYAGSGDAFAAKLNSSGVLQWNTFLGSSNGDYGESIAIDGSGNVYVAGRSYITWGSPVNAFAGAYGYDAFATKLNSNGVLQWNTFMGSSSIEYCRGIAVDGSGNVYLAGSSNATWGSPVNAFASTSGYDAFAAKLNNSGTRLWNTFMGSSTDDGGRSIAVDGSGNVYFAGSSDATWGSPVNAFASTYGNDAFAAKLNSSGVIQWNTFIGSSADDQGRSIAVDGSGNIYVAGYSDATWGSPVNAHVGSDDAFAAKFSNNGVRLWNTFMGGSSTDKGNSIAVDGSGNVYVAGTSILSSWGSPANAHAGGDDAFAAKLNSSGVLLWNTFMGTGDIDKGHNIAVDGSGNVYVAGESWESWGSPANTHAGNYDVFAIKFNYSDLVAVEIDLDLPTEFKLSQNYPNPFNPSTTIKFVLPGREEVKIEVFNALGRKVAGLINNIMLSGYHEVEFNSQYLPSGIYVYKITAGQYQAMKKMLFLQ